MNATEQDKVHTPEITRGVPPRSLNQRRTDWIDRALGFQPSIRSQALILILMLVCELAVFSADLEANASVSFAPLYSLIVLTSAWLLKLRFSIVVVLTSVILRVYGLRDNFQEIIPFHYLENIIITCASYAIFTLLIYRNKRLIVRLRRHATRVSNRRKLLAQRTRLTAAIRRALPEDSDKIVELVVLGVNSGAFSEGTLEPQRLKELSPLFKEAIITGQALRDLWQGGTTIVANEYWVVSLNQKIVASMMVIGIDQNDQLGRELHMIAVANEYRGLGIGSCLVDFYLEGSVQYLSHI